MICATSFAIADSSGSCGANGDNVTYNYYSDAQQLTLSGTGAMEDYPSYSYAPWYYRTVVTVVMTGSITTVGNYAFNEGTDLTNFTFCSSVESIGDHAFYYCRSLASITLPNALKQIKDDAFGNCVKLSSIQIPAQVNSIGDGAFSGCTSLTKFTVAASNQYYMADNGVLYNKNKTTLMYFPAADANNRTSYVVPDGVTTIGQYAFYNAAKLQSIELPRTIKTLDYRSLSSANLTSITCAAKVPPTATSYTFEDTPASAIITVPTGRTAAYKAAAGWSKFTNFVEQDYPDYVDPDCNVPTGVRILGPIGYNEATITWDEGNQSYFGLHYKKSSASEYTEYPNRVSKWDRIITLEQLEPLTSYDVIVYGVCGTSINSDTVSENSAVFTFTTADVPPLQSKPTVEEGWAYYGENYFFGTGDLASNTYWGIMIPANTNTDNYLDSVRVYAASTDVHEISLWEGGNTPAAAKQVWTQQFTPEVADDFNGVKLIEPLTVNKSKNLWVFCRNMGSELVYPTAFTTDVNAPNARWIGITGGDNVDWMDIQNFDPQLANLYIAWLVNPHYTKTPTYVAYVKDLAATKITTTSIALSWYGYKTFELRWRKQSETEWKTKANIAKKTYTITGLEATNTYEIQVRATYNGETTDWSDVLSVYIAENAAIDEIQIDKPQSSKTIIDGQLYIIHDGKMYNAAGMRIE